MPVALKCKILFILSFIVLSSCAYGQDSTGVLPRHAIKFSPLHLLNPELSSIQVAYEYRFADEFSVQLEGGYVNGGVWWTYASADADGYKFKEDIRWYFDSREFTKRREKKAYNGIYGAIEFHQTRISIHNFYNDVYRQNGVGMKAGFARYARWGLVIDLNAGLTFAKSNMLPFGVPLSEPQRGRSGYHAVLPILGVRLGYWFH